MSKIKSSLPGLLLSFFVTVLSFILSNFIPFIGAATIAILLGIILGNIFFKQTIFNNGTKLAETKFLEYAVVLLGLTINLQDIMQIGFLGIIFIVLQIIITIAFSLYLGKKLRFSRSFATLMATGNAICGSSAIASVAPVIDAKEDEKINAIALVNLMGTIMMFLLALLAHMLFSQNQLLQGALIGGTLQSVGQVVASASMLNEDVIKYATIFKIIRILCIVFVVIYFGQMKRQNELDTKANASKQKTNIKKLLPWYVIGFVLFCCLNSILVLPKMIMLPTKTLSSYLEITALAAIGLRLDLKSLLSKGKSLLLYGLGIGIIQISSAIILVIIFFVVL